jgi:hypothetical protein
MIYDTNSREKEMAAAAAALLADMVSFERTI